ncbi:LPXTG cell wall anchor domain-containing protein [Enterococcus sp. AZ109]|uniref:LPXTG cell wall anchor domain-containing protein n=1 Tax=Enterococcus sp. AZ109 TaxID=2774634 RepID=UPI003F295B14
MKKFVGLMVIASFFLTSAVSVHAATYNSVEKPNEPVIENASTWNRDVGDGVDTFKYENGKWVPVGSTSKRRAAARKDFIDKVVTPNKEARKKAEELKQSYIEQAKKDPEAFAALTENESMQVSYTDEQGTHEVKIPKVDMPEEIAEPAAFFTSEAVPEMLPIKTTPVPVVADPNQSPNQKADPSLTTTTYKVQNGKILTKAELLEQVAYDGDKTGITIELYSQTVYSAKDSTTYHHDLNALLATTTVDKINVLTEHQAVIEGLSAAPDDTKQIEKINLSLPGKYNVTLSVEGAVSNNEITVQREDQTIVDPVPTPDPLKLEVADQTFPVEVGKYLNNADLLGLAKYTGDINNLKVSITTDYVYVVAGAEVYHIDLHELLSKANLANISVMTEQEAINQGLRLSTENNDKGGIDTINRSLPGRYHVTYTDGQLTATSIITIGEVKKQEQPVPTTTPKKTTSTPKTYAKPSAKTLPKTGSTSSNYLIIIGVIVIAAAAFLFWKKKSKKA